MVNQQGDVFAPLAQGGQAQPDDVQSIEEILSEGSLLHLGFQVTVGGGHDAHVDFTFRHAPHRLDLAFLQHPQQLDLHGHRQLGHLVKQEGSAVSRLEQALLVDVGTGERALHMSEQFRLEQGFRDGPAIDGHEGPIRALGKFVQGTGRQLLAGAGFADQQHAGAPGAGLSECVEDPLHGRRFAQQPVQLVAALDFVTQGHVLAGQRPALESAIDHQANLVDLEGLGQVVVGARLHGRDGRLGAGKSGDHDDLRVGMKLLGLGQNHHAVDVRHAQVGDHHVELAFLHRRQGCAASGRRFHSMPGATQMDAQELAHGALVVDDQNVTGGLGHGFSSSCVR